MKTIQLFITVLTVVFYSKVFALDLNLKLSNDNFIKVQVYEANSDDVLVWLPSEYGNKVFFVNVAQNIRNLGLEVWLANIFAANYLLPSEEAIDRIDSWQLSEIISKIHASSQKRIWLFSSEKGARLVLRGMQQWQLDNPTKNYLGGAILLNPNLVYGVPPIGKKSEYLPITLGVNKPVFILQSEYSINTVYLDELTEQLRKGGAKIESKLIPKVRERFHFRKYKTDWEEKILYKEFPAFVNYALKSVLPLVKNSKGIEKLPPRKAVPFVDLPLNLNPIRKVEKFKSMDFVDLKGKLWNTNNLKGDVVILTFWADWCSSCRIQTKRQQQLLNTLKSDKLKILSLFHKVDEDTVTNIRQIKKRYELTFPLLEVDELLLQNYEIRRFPSTIILDKKGGMRYAFYGVPSWNNNSRVTSIINTLLEE